MSDNEPAYSAHVEVMVSGAPMLSLCVHRNPTEWVWSAHVHNQEAFASGVAETHARAWALARSEALKALDVVVRKLQDAHLPAPAADSDEWPEVRLG